MKINLYNILGGFRLDIENAVVLINKLNIHLDKFSIQDFITGYNIELEHGIVNERTNVTNNDPIMTAKIALAHLNEYPNYYNKEYGLPALERELKNRLNNN